MNRPVIFPARTPIRNSACGKAEILFEIYSAVPVENEEYRSIGKLAIDGDIWHHYTAFLDKQEYGGLIAERPDISSGTASSIASELFEKYFSSPGRPKIMGIVNVTPDSFYPGSRMLGKSFADIDGIMEQKPDIVDIGGESTRPGSRRLSADEEISRLKPVLEYISSSYDTPISLDTRNPETAEFSLKYGIQYLNDVSGFANDEMIRIVAENSLDCIIMHMRGTPESMQENTTYSDLIMELNLFFQNRTAKMIGSGVHPSRIIIDPGIGFGKGLEGNKELIRELESLNIGFRILAGASRKTFIGKITGEPVEKRLSGTLATSVYLMNVKCDFIRVHDVKANLDAIQVYRAILGT